MSDNNKNFEDAIVKLDFLRGSEENFEDAISQLESKLNNPAEKTNTINFTKNQNTK